MSADSGSVPEQFSAVGDSGGDEVYSEQDARRRIAELESEVSFLRAELERQEEARQDVIDRYESILGQRRTSGRRERPDGDSVALRVKRLLGLR